MLKVNLDRSLIVLVILASCSIAHALDGDAIKVTADQAPIKVQDRIVGYAPKDSWLWAFEFSKDTQWAWVKVPGSDAKGWMSARDAIQPEVPANRKSDLAKALQFFSRWNELIAEGKPQEAFEIAKQAGDTIRAVVWTDHPHAATAYNQAGVALVQLGDAARALELFETAIMISKRSLGALHENTLVQQANLGDALCSLGEFGKAITAFESSLPHLEDKSLPLVHMDTFYGNYGIALARAGQLLPAQMAFEKAMKIAVSGNGENSIEVASVTSSYANAMDKAGQRDLAVELMSQSLAIVRDLPDVDAQAVIHTINGLAAIHVRAQQFAEAKNLAVEALELQVEIEKPHAMNMAISLNILGLACAKLHQFDKAMEALEEAVKLMNAATEKGAFITSYPLKNLGILAIEQQQFPRAKKLLKEVLAIRLETQSDSHISVGEAKGLLAEVAFALSETENARRLAFESIRIQAAAVGVDHPDTRRWIDTLRPIIQEDQEARDKLNTLIAESRQRQGQQILGSSSASQSSPPSTSRFRLQTVLATKPRSKPETDFTALEVTQANAPVRSGSTTVATVPRGTIVYAFRPQGRFALIKVPGQTKIGWIHESSVREVTYTGTKLQRLEAAKARSADVESRYLKGDFAGAGATARRALATFVTELGEASVHVAIARYELGTVLSASGELREAIAECELAVEILADKLGNNHLTTAMAQNNLAEALLMAGRNSEALSPATSSLRIFSAAGTGQRANQAMVAGNIGTILGGLSHYESSREYLQYALKLCREARGENHHDTALQYANLGALHSALADSDAAEAAFAKAFEISRAVSGATHPRTTDAMSRYGESLVAVQRVASGRKMIDQAAAINLQQRGAFDLSTISTDFTRASLLHSLGDYRSAEELMKSVLQRAERKLGKSHPSVATYRAALAELLFADEQFEAALSEFQNVLVVRRKLLGDENHDTIYSVNAVGICLDALGRLNEARLHYEEAMRLARKVLGPNHPDTAAYLFNLGEAASMERDYVAARPMITSAIEVFQGTGETASENVAVAQTALGYADVAQGDTRRAMETFDNAARGTFQLLSRVMPVLSEQEQLTFLQNRFRELIDGWLSLVFVAPQESLLGEKTAEWLINFKGTSHELLARRAQLNQQMARANNATVRQLTHVREQLARMSLRTVPPGAIAAHNESTRKLAAEERRLARESGEAASRFQEQRQWVDMESCRSQIPESSIFIDFARIRQANYQYASYADKWRPDRYVAWIIPPRGEGRIEAVDLGLADEVDALVSRCLQKIASQSALDRMRTHGETEAMASAETSLRELATKVLDPLVRKIGDVEELVMSPDGQLWTIPWAALPIADEQFLIERYQLRLVTSGRELAGRKLPNGTSTGATAPIIVADPQFDLHPSSVINHTNESQSRRRFSSQLRNVQRLPGTASEAAAIQDSVESFAGISPKMYLQKMARESVVKSANRPVCLVASTHGFFFEQQRSKSAKSSRSRLSSSTPIIENPLLRCGLLFAGCHHADSVPVGADDGILTGLEITNLRLRDTELVVLSACETGLGDLRAGEGVAGLRQAFQLAGAKSVVASLWQVSDLATARLMDSFFENLAQGMNKSQALRQAQLTRIKSRRNRYGAAHPYFWAAFTLTGMQ